MKLAAWLCLHFHLMCPPAPTPSPTPVPPPPPPVVTYKTALYHQGSFDRYDANEKEFLTSHHKWLTFSPDKYLNDLETYATKNNSTMALYVKTLGVKPTDAWYQEAFDNNLFWRGTEGGIITNPANGWLTLDVIGKTDGVATLWINQIKRKLLDEPYTGVFFDNANIPDGYMPTDKMPGYTPEAYLAAVSQIVTKVRAAYPGLKLLANGLVFNAGTDSTKDGGSLLPVLDGAMSELYSLKSGSELKSYGLDRLWYRIKRIRELSKQNKTIVLLDDVASEDKTNFSFCMYLLSRDSSGNVLWSKGTPEQVLNYAQDDVSLGLPISEPMLNGGLVSRQFQKGSVWANIGSVNEKVFSNSFGSYYVFSGNGTFKTAKPVWSVVPVTGEIVLSPLKCVVGG